MTKFFQLFIYSNGEVGLIKEHGSPEVQVASSQLTTVEPLVEYIKSLKPEDMPERGFFRISITKNGMCVYTFDNYKDKESDGLYKVRGDLALIDNLVNEILSVLPQE